VQTDVLYQTALTLSIYIAVPVAPLVVQRYRGDKFLMAEEKRKMTREEAAVAAVKHWNKTPLAVLKKGLEEAKKLPVPDATAQALLDSMETYIKDRERKGQFDAAEDVPAIFTVVSALALGT
jgi:hypothetical protein